MLSHGQIWQAIETLAQENNLSPSGLARLAGLDPTSFNKSKRTSADGRLRWPSTESMAKILEATGTNFDAFARLATDVDHGDYANLKQMGRAADNHVPLLGFAQAGSGGFFDDAGFPQGQGWDEIAFPAAANGADNGAQIYALEVHGDSMMPLYRDGDILIVEPSAAVRKNDRVVVRTKAGEVMAKILSRNGPTTIELLSLNPEHPTRQFDRTEIDWTARIIWASQ